MGITTQSRTELDALISDLMGLSAPIKLTLTVSPDRLPEEEEAARLCQRLADEVPQISFEKKTLPIIDEMVLVPRISWNDGKSAEDRFVFVGLPTSHEFRSFSEGLKIAGGLVSRLADDSVVEELSSMSKPLQIKTYVSTECQKCPEAAIAGYRFAAASPLISHEVIEINKFAWFQNNYNFAEVPKMVFNQDKFFAGGVLPDEIRLLKIREALRN